MTKREAAIVTMYTGILIGDFRDAHKYAEEIVKKPIFTHEMGCEKFCAELKALAHDDFISMEVTG